MCVGVCLLPLERIQKEVKKLSQKMKEEEAKLLRGNKSKLALDAVLKNVENELATAIYILDSKAYKKEKVLYETLENALVMVSEWRVRH